MKINFLTDQKKNDLYNYHIIRATWRNKKFINDKDTHIQISLHTLMVPMLYILKNLLHTLVTINSNGARKFSIFCHKKMQLKSYVNYKTILINIKFHNLGIFYFSAPKFDICTKSYSIQT